MFEFVQNEPDIIAFDRATNKKEHINGYIFTFIGQKER